MFPVGTATFANAQGMSSHAHIDPSNVWADADPSPVDPVDNANNSHPPSHQGDIVKSRPEHVTQRWGQITPPDDGASGNKRKDSAQFTGAQSVSKPKLDNAERARNAANSRHSRAKKSRQASEQESQSGPSEGSDDDDVEDKREKYREKNRLAAAKCRLKKKDNVETLEIRHRDLSAKNNYMKREERKLRDELSRLRTMALGHCAGNPNCRCDPLHYYNQRQMRALACGFGPSMAPVSSPSHSSISSASGSNAGFDPTTGAHSMPSSTPPNLMLSMPTTVGSFSSPSSYAFATVTTPQSMEMASATAGPEPQEFASFLQSSPNGRAGFS